MLRQHMAGKVDIWSVAEVYARKTGNEMEGRLSREQVGCYVLYKTLGFDSCERLVLHKEVLQKAYTVKYVPGLVSAYGGRMIKEMGGGGNKQIGLGVLDLLLWVVRQIKDLGEVFELEERLGLLLRQLDVKDSLELAIEIFRRSKSRPFQELAVECILAAGGYTAGIEQEFSGIANRVLSGPSLEKELEIAGEAVVRMAGIVPGAADEVVKACISKAMSLGPGGKREGLIAWLSRINQQEGLNQQAWGLLGGKEESVLAKGSIESSSSSKSVISQYYSQQQERVSLHAGQAQVFAAVCRLESNWVKIARQVSGEEFLFLAEVCRGVQLQPGTEESRIGLLRVLEVTGEKAFLDNHPISKLIQIETEIKTGYDAYLNVVFKEKYQLKHSVNIVNALVDYAYQGRIVDIAIQLGSIIKHQDYIARVSRWQVNKPVGDIGLISRTLIKIIDKSYFKKTDLVQIFKSLVYLISTENQETQEAIFSILASILRMHAELDKGIKPALYGLPRSTSLSISQTESSADTNDQENTMVIANLIFEEILGADLHWQPQLSLLSLINTMIRCTGDFLVGRIEDQILGPVLRYYLQKRFVLPNQEIKILGEFLLLICQYPIQFNRYFDLVQLLLIHYDSKIAHAETSLNELFRRNKYALLFALANSTARAGKEFHGCSRHSRQLIQRIFAK
ncbi:hypothetical protein NEHOM01_2039 [Nematocida homosporus]|uniref:uncharacterized protein n=1 Tax=Nematocida homosporus TaxID=1912981 RepID=UPI00221FD06F|nr:uncharacterized protein NEHOM01_2039 [Nematocida homosporus]KAI5187243.1 hypothetical protein NEHOM01_2039 [Nematocida homosporus]